MNRKRSSSAETAHHYAAIRHELEDEGTPIPDNDHWIAAVARKHGVALLSNDRISTTSKTSRASAGKGSGGGICRRIDIRIFTVSAEQQETITGDSVTITN